MTLVPFRIHSILSQCFFTYLSLCQVWVSQYVIYVSVSSAQLLLVLLCSFVLCAFAFSLTPLASSGWICSLSFSSVSHTCLHLSFPRSPVYVRLTLVPHSVVSSSFIAVTVASCIVYCLLPLPRHVCSFQTCVPPVAFPLIILWVYILILFPVILCRIVPQPHAVCSFVPLFCSGLAPCLLSYLQYVTSDETVHISLLCSAYWFHGLPAAQQHMRQRAGVTEEGATDSVRWR